MRVCNAQVCINQNLSLSLCAYTLYPQFQYGRNPPAMAQLPKNSIYLHSDDARVDCFVLP